MNAAVAWAQKEKCSDVPPSDCPLPTCIAHSSRAPQRRREERMAENGKATNGHTNGHTPSSSEAKSLVEKLKAEMAALDERKEKHMKAKPAVSVQPPLHTHRRALAPR